MKQFIVTILIALLASPAGFAQNGKKSRVIAPLIAEEPIRHILVAGNVDVLLIEDHPSNVGVRVPVSSVEKINVRIEGDYLYLTASAQLAEGERVEAYVTVSDLNSLELKGNVVATSKGILESRQLKLITNQSAIVAIRSEGPVMVACPGTYQVVREDKYYSVFAGNL